MQFHLLNHNQKRPSRQAGFSTGKRLNFLWIALVCFVSTFSGCGREPKLQKSAKPEAARCDELISNALDVMYPERLGITSNSGTVVGILNKWVETCGSDAETKTPLSSDAARLLGGVLSSQELGDLDRRNYSTRDVEHIRDCLLYKAVVDSALITAKTDIQRCVELFYWVTRNVAMIPEKSLYVPLTPYEIVILGRGSAEDRAWVFSNLLRQIRIDVVIIRPSSSAAGNEQSVGESKSGHWLVGALLDEKVYLFDMKLGLPIPSKNDLGKDAFVSLPATLSDVLENDDILRRFDMTPEQAYPLKSREFKNLHVELVGDRGFWVPRMKNLQLSLSGESVLIFDGIGDSDFGDGLITRVVEYGAGKWKKNDLSIWEYPEKAFQRIASATAEEKQTRIRILRRFDTPLETVSDEKTKQSKLDRPSKRLLIARVDQVMGGYGKVLKRYQLLRQELIHPEFSVRQNIMIPLDLRQTYSLAAEDVFFWTAACQVEQKEYSAAIETLKQYKHQIGPQGSWYAHYEYLQAVSFAESRKYAAALQALRRELQTGRLGPIQRNGYQFLVNRWRTLRESSLGKSDEVK